LQHSQMKMSLEQELSNRVLKLQMLEQEKKNMELSLKDQHARELAAQKQEVANQQITIKLKDKEKDDEKKKVEEETRVKVMAVATREKDDEVNKHVSQINTLKLQLSDAEAARNKQISDLQLSLKMKHDKEIADAKKDGEAQVQAINIQMAKVRRDADEDRVKVNAAASKKESELNVKLASLDGLPEKIKFLESDLESKKKSYTLSLK